MKPLLLIALLLLANTVAAAEPISGKKHSQSEPSTKQRLTTEEMDAEIRAFEPEIRAVEKALGLDPSGDTMTKRRYTTEELDAMQEAEQSRRAAEKARAQFSKDNYACLLEYRTSGPAIQAPSVGGGNELAAMLQIESERRRENKYVQACLESKGWTFPARNAESTK